MSRVRELRKFGYFRMDDATVDHWAKIIGPHAFTVYAALCRHAGDNGRSWPGVRTLANRLGMKPETVRKAIRALEGHRLIHVERRQVKGFCHKSHLYDVLNIPRPPTDEPTPLFDKRLNEAPEGGGPQTDLPPGYPNGPGGGPQTDRGEVPKRSSKEDTLKEDTLKDSSSSGSMTPKAQAEPLAAADADFDSNTKTATEDATPRPQAAPITLETEALLAELKQRGLSGAVAKRSLEQVADLALAREILCYFDEVLPTGHFENPLAVLRSMFKDPQGKWGFERSGHGWKRPPRSANGKGPPLSTPETVEVMKDRLNREREKQSQEWQRIEKEEAAHVHGKE